MTAHEHVAEVARMRDFSEQGCPRATGLDAMQQVKLAIDQ
jgi:hypothetical protein